MTRYKRVFGTDWEALGIDSATDRAYAIGILEEFGENNRGELQAIYDEMDSAYDRSIVELAYEEGQTKARDMINNENDEDDIWSYLLPDGWNQNESQDTGNNDYPELLSIDSLLDRSNIDSTGVLDCPDFLNK